MSRPLVEVAEARVFETKEGSETLDGSERPAVLASDNPEWGSHVRLMALELRTVKYLAVGYITEDQLNSDGLYIDGYDDRSTYLISDSRTRLSTCRYIHATEEGIVSLPTIKSFAVDMQTILDTARVDMPQDIQPEEVIEVSALVSMTTGVVHEGRRETASDATQTLYARILRASVESGHKLWLLNTQEKLVRNYMGLVGSEQVRLLGPAQPYMNIMTYPVAINPHDVITATLRDPSDYGVTKRAYLRQAFQGVNDDIVSDELLAFLHSNNT